MVFLAFVKQSNMSVGQIVWDFDAYEILSLFFSRFLILM